MTLKVKESHELLSHIISRTRKVNKFNDDAAIITANNTTPSPGVIAIDEPWLHLATTHE